MDSDKIVQPIGGWAPAAVLEAAARGAIDEMTVGSLTAGCEPPGAAPVLVVDRRGVTEMWAAEDGMLFLDERLAMAHADMISAAGIDGPMVRNILVFDPARGPRPRTSAPPDACEGTKRLLETVSDIIAHGPTYDWNADPMWFTRRLSDAVRDVEETIVGLRSQLNAGNVPDDEGQRGGHPAEDVRGEVRDRDSDERVRRLVERVDHLYRHGEIRAVHVSHGDRALAYDFYISTRKALRFTLLDTSPLRMAEISYVPDQSDKPPTSLLRMPCDAVQKGSPPAIIAAHVAARLVEHVQETKMIGVDSALAAAEYELRVVRP